MSKPSKRCLDQFWSGQTNFGDQKWSGQTNLGRPNLVQLDQFLHPKLVRADQFCPDQFFRDRSWHAWLLIQRKVHNMLPCSRWKQCNESNKAFHFLCTEWFSTGYSVTAKAAQTLLLVSHPIYTMQLHRDNFLSPFAECSHLAPYKLVPIQSSQTKLNYG